MLDFERKVLSRIAFGNFPDNPGAAWFAACEALAGRGHVKNGEITVAGRAALVSS